jgi:uncharacterized membrane protein (DUF2068 family)
MKEGRPLTGVIATAAAFWLAGLYLWTLGMVMLIAPGAISMALGAPLLNGLELSGPYMFLLIGVISGLLGWGLWRRNNWARRIAILAALAGLAMTLPSLSVAVMNFRITSFLIPGLGALVRMLIVWYLYQAPVTEWFAGRNDSGKTLL